MVVARFVRSANLDGSGVAYVPLEGNGKDEVLSVLSFGTRARAYVDRDPPDIIKLSERFSALSTSSLKIPKVFTFHNYDAARTYRRTAIQSHWANVALFPVKRRLEELVMSRCDRVIVPCKSILSYLKGVGIEHGVFISHGLKVEDYSNRSEEGFVLFAGRLHWVKGLDVLLRAFALIHDQVDAKLIVAGDGPHRLELQSLAAKLGLADRVAFLGYVPRESLSQLFSICTVFVLPSRWETFGIVLAEAMASGKPVIASDVPGPTSQVVDSENGLLFPSGDYERLASLLLELLTDVRLRRALGERAENTAREKLSFDRIAMEHERLFEGIISDHFHV